MEAQKVYVVWLILLRHKVRRPWSGIQRWQWGETLPNSSHSSTRSGGNIDKRSCLHIFYTHSRIIYQGKRKWCYILDNWLKRLEKALLPSLSPPRGQPLGPLPSRSSTLFPALTKQLLLHLHVTYQTSHLTPLHPIQQSHSTITTQSPQQGKTYSNTTAQRDNLPPSAHPAHVTNPFQLLSKTQLSSWISARHLLPCFIRPT